ncbi:MAG TPA: divalent-cation tolerance protein CutA [Spirochaetia bacterium]|nr:divalent-cation tolerance protein CutA [Spirochaetia bacterium]
MQDVQRSGDDFWKAAQDATRVILVPFGTVLAWVFGVVLVGFPGAVDRAAGYGQILPIAAYLVLGALLLVSAAWHTLMLVRRRLTPFVLTLSSVLNALAACFVAYFIATSGAPFRPLFAAFLWVLVVYMVLSAGWYSITAWTAQIDETADSDSSPVPVSVPGSFPAVSAASLPVAPSPGDVAVRLPPSLPSATLCLAMMTAPSDRAEVIARRLVDERLAACAQVPGEMTSFYWWDGQVNRERERIVYLKTRTDLLSDIQSVLAEVHPYKLPELILLPLIGGLPDYLRWMQTELKPSPGAPQSNDASTGSEGSA